MLRCTRKALSRLSLAPINPLPNTIITILKDGYSLWIAIEIELWYDDISHLSYYAEEVSGLDEIGVTMVSVNYYSSVYEWALTSACI